jgi:hypothetical protein
MIRMSARADVVAQYFNRKYVTENSGMLNQMVVGPDEAAVLIRNGAIEEIATAEKLDGLGAGVVGWMKNKLGGGEDLNFLMVVTSPIELKIPVGGQANPQATQQMLAAGRSQSEAVSAGMASSELMTKDGFPAMGVVTIRISFDPNNAAKVMNLMSSIKGRGFQLTGQMGDRGLLGGKDATQGDPRFGRQESWGVVDGKNLWGRKDAASGIAEITEEDLIAKFWEELIVKVYRTQIKQYNAGEIFGNPDLTKETDALCLTEMRKTLDTFGVTVQSVFTLWNPNEFDRVQQENARKSLEFNKIEFESALRAAQQSNDQKRQFELTQAWETMNNQLQVLQQQNRIMLERSQFAWDQEKTRAEHVARLQREKEEDVQDAEQMDRMIALKGKMKDQKVDEFQRTQLESQKVGAQVEIEKARMQAEAAKYNIDTYERAMDRALGHAERTASLNAGMMGAAKANVPTTVVTGSNTAYTTVPAAGGVGVTPAVGPKCPHCGAGVQSGWKACPACANSLAAPKCPHCGGDVQAGWKACPSCGKALGGG